MNKTSNQISSPPSIMSRVITQGIAIVFFVVIPILITFFVPFTNIEFRNTNSGARASITRYVLIFIPWKTEEVLNVSGVRAEIKSEKYYADTSENRRKGQTGVSLATAQLVLINDGPEVIVQSDPELAKTTVKEFEEFLASKSDQPMYAEIYASWGLSYILGGVATFFCALYVIGSAITILMFPFKLIRSKLK